MTSIAKKTIDIMDCGEISCEYCSKDKCIYMTYNNGESEVQDANTRYKSNH